MVRGLFSLPLKREHLVANQKCHRLWHFRSGRLFGPCLGHTCSATIIVPLSLVTFLAEATRRDF
jgi:hypothetical protein